jgi:hypothetical protein
MSKATSKDDLKLRELEVRDAAIKADVRKMQFFEARINELAELRADITLWKDKVLQNPNDKKAQDRYDLAYGCYSKARAFIDGFGDYDEKIEPSLTALQQRAEALRLAQERPSTVTRGEFVQRYDPDTHLLLDHFAGPTEAIRQFEAGCPQNLMKAVKERTIYKGYRWASVPRDGDPTVVQDIGENVASRQGGGGMVAVYSHDETRIEHVFPDQLTTKDHLKVKAAATVSQAISSNLARKCAGVYLQLWVNVPENLKEKYLETKLLPEPAERKGGRPVLQLDMHTGQVIKRHGNIATVAKDFRMSHMTVKKACDTGEAHGGFRWKFVEERPERN